MAIADHADPQSKADMTKCLQILMQIQAKDHANAKQVGAAQQVAQSLGSYR